MNLQKIVEIVCEDYNINPFELLLKTRQRRIVEPKQVTQFFCKGLTQLSYAEIGFFIGRNNHATVMHSCKVVLNMMETYHAYRERIQRIETKLMIEALKDYQPKPSMNTYSERKAMLLSDYN